MVCTSLCRWRGGRSVDRFLMMWRPCVTGRAPVVHYRAAGGLRASSVASTHAQTASSKRNVLIRDAQPSDVRFLARVILLAARSQVSRGVFDVYFAGFSDEDMISVLADMTSCSPDKGSACCWAGKCLKSLPLYARYSSAASCDRLHRGGSGRPPSCCSCRLWLRH